MNTLKKIRMAFIAVAGLLVINSCVKDDDWRLPPIECNDTWVADLSIEELFDMVNNAGTILSFDEERIVEGYVVSSDSTGNFFKTVSIQNDLVNPTKALQVEMDRTNLFNDFPFGSKMVINLKGLNVGYDRGMLKIGQNYEQNGEIRVGRMAEVMIDGHVARACGDRVNATPVNFNSVQELLDNGVFNTLATIHNIQFDDSELGTTYADAVGLQTINKKLIDSEGKTIVLRNSGYASFAGDPIPEGSGSITVVVSGYDGNNNGTVSPSEYQLFISSTDDVNFDQPRFGDGPGPEPGEYISCLDEGFETYAVDFQNFPNYENITISGNRKWQVTEFGGNKYIQLSAHNASGSIVSYFVVPVNFSNADELSFKTKAGYDNGSALKVYYSTNYTIGQINAATLVDITSQFTIPAGPANGYSDIFSDSGVYSLAGLSGNGAIVFAYEGAGNGVTTTIQIDDIKIIDNDDPDCGSTSPEPGDEPTPPTANAKPLFAGHDFEDWADFMSGLNNFGLKPYATQSQGTGMDGSASLWISTNSTTTNTNDYVFTNQAIGGYMTPSTKLHFYMKGTSSKSVSLNVYKTDGTYYTFNLGTLSQSSIIEVSGNNQYTGTIDTNGQWVLIELDLSGMSDLNLSDSGDIFALKIGRNADYDLHFDNFTIE
ncbi:MAG: DUF5689 domain-containing protein [Weeksellaceae bacterium]